MWCVITGMFFCYYATPMLTIIQLCKDELKPHFVENTNTREKLKRISFHVDLRIAHNMTIEWSFGWLQAPSHNTYTMHHTTPTHTLGTYFFYWNINGYIVYTQYTVHTHTQHRMVRIKCSMCITLYTSVYPTVHIEIQVQWHFIYRCIIICTTYSAAKWHIESRIHSDLLHAFLLFHYIDEHLSIH